MCNQRIVQSLPLTKKAAYNVFVHSLPHVLFDKDDLEQIAALGLIDADKRFDSSKGASFSTYAQSKIKWAISDARREEFGRTTSRPEFFSLDEEVFDTGGRPVRKEELVVDEESPDQFEYVHRKELITVLSKAIDCLTKTEREVITAVYFKGESPVEVARRRGVTEAAVSIARKLALCKLRKYMKGVL
uniref:Putative sigma-70 region domain containing protein n=1 Tax=viral metagenome TaxID=1070528 RepID=A0A6M3K6F5_9ZZZZ